MDHWEAKANLKHRRPQRQRKSEILSHDAHDAKSENSAEQPPKPQATSGETSDIDESDNVETNLSDQIDSNYVGETSDESVDYHHQPTTRTLASNPTSNEQQWSARKPKGSKLQYQAGTIKVKSIPHSKGLISRRQRSYRRKRKANLDIELDCEHDGDIERSDNGDDDDDDDHDDDYNDMDGDINYDCIDATPIRAHDFDLVAERPLIDNIRSQRAGTNDCKRSQKKEKLIFLRQRMGASNKRKVSTMEKGDDDGIHSSATLTRDQCKIQTGGYALDRDYIDFNNNSNNCDGRQYQLDSRKHSKPSHNKPSTTAQCSNTDPGFWRYQSVLGRLFKLKNPFWFQSPLHEGQQQEEPSVDELKRCDQQTRSRELSAKSSYIHLWQTGPTCNQQSLPSMSSHYGTNTRYPQVVQILDAPRRPRRSSSTNSRKLRDSQRLLGPNGYARYDYERQRSEKQATLFQEYASEFVECSYEPSYNSPFHNHRDILTNLSIVNGISTG